MIGFIIFFVVVFIIVLAFKKDKTVTTITRKDENGKEIVEKQVTEHHSAGQTAARIVLGIVAAIFLIVVGLIIYACIQAR